MTTLVIKNLPEQLHDKLRAQAARNRRSITKEVVTLIESSVNPQRPEATQPARRQRSGGMTLDELEAAITDNRYSHYKSLDELNRYMDELRADRDEVKP